MKKASLFFLLVVFLASLASARIIYRCTSPKDIALTFDDGPSANYTEKVLDILKKHKVQATFFMVGSKVQKYPKIVLRAVDEGHTLGNHTYNHSRIDWINDQKLFKELKQTSDVIGLLSGKKVRLFRPPYGRLPRSKRKLIQKAGYDIVLWSVNADDFYHKKKGVRNARSITARVLSQVKGGDIILMHDTSKEMAEALPGIIKGLKKRGFRFVRL